MKRKKGKLKNDIIFWREQAGYWKRRAITAESLNKKFKIEITQLPLEILWTIIGFLDFESSILFSQVLKVEIIDTYKYYYFKLEESPDDFPFFCESIRKLIENKEIYLDALLKNTRFRQLVDIHKVLALASSFGYINVIKKLLLWKVDPSRDENLAFRIACQNGHDEVVLLLMNDKRVDPGCCSNYPILYASRNGHLNIVKILLNDARVDPSDVDNWAIRKAAYLGHVEIVMLLQNNFNVRNMNGFEKFWQKYTRNDKIWRNYINGFGL